MTALSAAALPLPDAGARAHAARVAQALRGEIGTGSISFERFMHQALYAPGLGYYMAGQARFGAGGDFVTAPESTPVFARALAAPVAEVVRQCDGSVLELGGGSGVLAEALLPALAALNAAPKRYELLEPSPALRRQQQRRLRALPAALGERVRWIDALPAAFSGAILANEVADALPVRRFCIDHGAVRELRTGVHGARLCDLAVAAGDGLGEWIGALQEDIGHALPHDYCSEWCPSLGPWVVALGACLRRGALLLIDYGYGRREYYRPERTRGTLVCHYRHRVHDDPYWYPGLQDISASVDFTAVAEAGAGCGLELEGYTSQAAFLLDAGVLSLVPGAGATPAAVAAQSRLHDLLQPGAMGERFKVMGLSRGLRGVLPGFRGRQQTHSL